MSFEFNDGGRKESGRKGSTGDCVCRAIAIASELPYEEVYKRLAEGNATQRKSKRQWKDRKKTASEGITTKRKWFKDYMKELGFEWVATMGIGTGCTTHLCPDELPKGRLVVNLSRHLTTMIDGVINDTYNPQRVDIEGNQKRCVYGYWELIKRKEEPKKYKEKTTEELTIELLNEHPDLRDFLLHGVPIPPIDE